MWKFWTKIATVPLSEDVKRHLANAYGVSDDDAASLCMLEQRGHHAGQRVTYIRVFDRSSVNANGVDLQHFGNLSTRRMLAYSGHLARNGQIVLREKTVRRPTRAAPSVAYP